ncbi:respiratory chain complex I subunit 1 family protein [Sporomusa sp. KB1]|jgi:formate hydrogenlyase subunit 4|uniref:respiratory chain complex I subunit 1 family protein n=1 Tax=Sporomusa sp. KB1 TaxID=943346 RepID=UPI0011A7A92F|nr:NADH-quinone oxidoreductase subunit H [Sporomusa sp. KB1]TWH46505.1 formate hydrogenlyase subunit 4 [Sporomusa sp. KB1]
MSITATIIQVIALVILAPLVQGIVKNTKGRLQSRRGPGYFQPYFDFVKFLAKDSVVSPTVSWVFHFAPYIYFATAIGAAALVPTIFTETNGQFDNLFILVYLLALGRFFLAIASLDAGSSFGGMGGSREMFVSVLVEPALMITLFTVAISANSTVLSAMASNAASEPISLSTVLAAIAFLIITVAETGRIPVDNPDTHLELTMIHEGMVLEYSGRSVGLIFWAAAIKQLVFILLLIKLFIPWDLPGFDSNVMSAVSMFTKVLIMAVLLACIESSTNKMRLFRVPGLMVAAGCLSLLALVAQ